MIDAVADSILDRNPVAAARAPRVPKPDLAVIRPEHVKALLATIGSNRWEIPIRLAAMTGMRRSEVLALSWRQVDLDAGTIRITRSLHASASFTISNYEHVVSEMQEATADALERRLGG
jgi:integrase